MFCIIFYSQETFINIPPGSLVDTISLPDKFLSKTDSFKIKKNTLALV